MACIAPVMMFSGFSQAASLSTVVFTAGSLTANVVRDFFMNIFLHPGDNMIGVGVVCVLAAAPLVGLAFLIKLLYNKFCPERT